MIRKIILVILVFSFLGSFAFISVTSPNRNFDMIFYSSIILNLSGSNEMETHENVFKKLQIESPDKYKDWSKDDYFLKVKNDFDYYKSHFPFYNIRPMYNWSSLMLYKSGVDLFLSTSLVSTISILIGLVLIIILLYKNLENSYLLLLILLYDFPSLLSVSGLSSPDGMVFLFLCIYFIVFFKSKESYLHHFILPFFILIRTDMIVFNFIVFGLNFYRKKKISFEVIPLLFSVALYLLINNHFDNYGWETIIKFTFLDKYIPMSQMQITIIEYCSIMINGIKDLIQNKSFFLFLLICGLNFFLSIKFKLLSIKFQDFILVCLLYVCIHFLLFPSIKERFFVGLYTLNFVVFILQFDKLLSKVPFNVNSIK